ncbi:MAG: hypothetical protein ACUVUF_05980 [Candidatus Bathycorpusculaceae bacterium]
MTDKNHMITFTEHAKTKLLKELKKLGITKQLITKTLKNPDELLYYALTERYVAINWNHNIAIIHEKTDNNITVGTVIYSTELKDVMDRRKRTERWIQ